MSFSGALERSIWLSGHSTNKAEEQTSSEAGMDQRDCSSDASFSERWAALTSATRGGGADVDPVEVLEAGQRLADIPLREAVMRMHPHLRRVAAYHLGLTSAVGVRSRELAVYPTLALLAAEAAGDDPLPALTLAAATEMAHGFWLLHEDAIDGNRIRGQRLAAWVAFGLRDAILTGQALSFLALEVLTADRNPWGTVAAERLNEALSELVRGKTHAIWLDAQADVNVEEYLTMVGHKAALFAYATATGALMSHGHVATAETLGALGRQLGLIHQLVVELRAKAHPAQEPGTPVGGRTATAGERLPVGWDWARREIRQRLRAALDALEGIDMPGRTRDELASLTWHFAKGINQFRDSNI
jgi:geranylgeranyl diphosphate synthase type I